MVALIEIPDNKNESAFILEVLKRLNVRIFDNNEVFLSDDVLAEHTDILRERRKVINATDAQFFSWEAAQKELVRRKKEKAIV